jgi:hypothetical protein
VILAIDDEPATLSGAARIIAFAQQWRFTHNNLVKTLDLQETCQTPI